MTAVISWDASDRLRSLLGCPALHPFRSKRPSIFLHAWIPRTRWHNDHPLKRFQCGSPRTTAASEIAWSSRDAHILRWPNDAKRLNVGTATVHRDETSYLSPRATRIPSPDVPSPKSRIPTSRPPDLPTSADADP